MPPLPQPDNRVFLGVGGSGKSTLARHQSWSLCPRVIVCDPNGEPANEAGAFVVEDKAELVALMREPAQRVCWRGFDLYGEEEGLEWAARVAMAAGDCLLVMDETDLFTPFITFTSAAYRIWNTGRHHGCRVFAIARSPFAIPRTFTRNTTRVMVFGTQEPSDLAYLAGTRTKPGLIGPAAAEAVAKLPKYHAVDWQRGGQWVEHKAPFD